MNSYLLKRYEPNGLLKYTYTILVTILHEKRSLAEEFLDNKLIWVSV